MSIYMKPDGISGDVTAKGYQDWIECQQLYFGGVSKAVHTAVGDSDNRIQSRPYFSEIALVKYSDISSPAIFEYAHSNAVIPQVDIHLIATGDSLSAYEKYVLSNVYVSHASREFSAGQARPYEFVTLNYEKIETTFIPRNAKGQAGTPIRAGYNLSQAEKM